MKEHLNKCKKYQAAYRQKLTSKKLTDGLKEELKSLERDLDEVNIRIQRQLAEREVKKKIEDDKKIKAETSGGSGGGGYFGWMWGSKKPSTDETTEVAKTVKKLEEALTPAEKKELFEAIDYQVKQFYFLNLSSDIYRTFLGFSKPSSFYASNLFFIC